MSDSRPSWDSYFLQIAELARSRSSCARRHVGAVAVRDRRIIATGYNGTAAGLTNCNEGGCARCNAPDTKTGADLGTCFCCHAEENIVAQCARFGFSLTGASVYTTTQPCLICARLMINAGVSHVVYQESYTPEGTDLLTRAGVEVVSAAWLQRPKVKAYFEHGMIMLMNASYLQIRSWNTIDRGVKVELTNVRTRKGCMLTHDPRDSKFWPDPEFLARIDAAAEELLQEGVE